MVFTNFMKEILNSPWLMSLDDIFDIAFICPPYERIVYGDLIEVNFNLFLLERCNY